MIDTLRCDTLGCYGNEAGVSPRIDGISAEAVRFEQAVSTSGWTLPAVASLFTGAWPTIHGAQGKGTNLTPIRDELPTAAEILQAEGFNTLAVANAAFVSPLLRLDRGFDVYDHRHAYNWNIRRADETIETALDLLGAHQHESNFVFIHLFDPHLDYDPPAGYQSKFTAGRQEPAPPLGMPQCRALQTKDGQGPPAPADIDYVRGVYYGEVNFADVQVGRLVDALKEMGIYERTTLIITADHGEEFWEHGDFEHGHTLYDELIRIPLIVKLPGSDKPPAPVVETQVRILDIMPTVFDLLGIEKPASFVGCSFLPSLRGNRQKDLIAFSEKTLYGPERWSWRTGQYKYIFSVDADGRQQKELYDWRREPGEKENLIEQKPRVAEQLHGELSDFMKQLQAQSQSMLQPKTLDLRPQTVESLKSLGYIR